MAPSDIAPRDVLELVKQLPNDWKQAVLDELHAEQPSAIEGGDGCHDSAEAARFRALVEEWRQATALSSSITEIATHPSYQQIIGMGRAALPLIFEELRTQPEHWFWALRAITGEDPIGPSERGKLHAMTRAWLDWAERVYIRRTGSEQSRRSD